MIDGRIETALGCIQRGDYGSAYYLITQVKRAAIEGHWGTAATAQLDAVAYKLLDALAERCGYRGLRA